MLRLRLLNNVVLPSFFFKLYILFLFRIMSIVYSKFGFPFAYAVSVLL